MRVAQTQKKQKSRDVRYPISNMDMYLNSLDCQVHRNIIVYNESKQAVMLVVVVVVVVRGLNDMH